MTDANDDRLTVVVRAICNARRPGVDCGYPACPCGRDRYDLDVRGARAAIVADDAHHAAKAQGMVTEEVVDVAEQQFGDTYEAAVRLGSANWTDNRRAALRATLEAVAPMLVPRTPLPAEVTEAAISVFRDRNLHNAAGWYDGLKPLRAALGLPPWSMEGFDADQAALAAAPRQAPPPPGIDIICGTHRNGELSSQKPETPDYDLREIMHDWYYWVTHNNHSKNWNGLFFCGEWQDFCAAIGVPMRGPLAEPPASDCAAHNAPAAPRPDTSAAVAACREVAERFARVGIVQPADLARAFGELAKVLEAMP